VISYSQNAFFYYKIKKGTSTNIVLNTQTITNIKSKYAHVIRVAKRSNGAIRTVQHGVGREFGFREVSPKIRRVSLTGVTLMGR
jgi:hypothetical protein